MRTLFGLASAFVLGLVVAKCLQLYPCPPEATVVRPRAVGRGRSRRGRETTFLGPSTAWFHCTHGGRFYRPAGYG